MILDVLSAFGGLKITLSGIFSIIVSLVTRRFMENDILGSLFLVEKHTNYDKNEDEMRQGTKEIDKINLNQMKLNLRDNMLS